MPFVSQNEKRAREQVYYQQERIVDASFGEVFGAAVDITFDEEMWYSSMLNREGWDERKRVVERLIDEGSLDKEKYSIPAPRGARAPRFLWDKVAEDFEDVKPERQLIEERNKLLADRRAYAEDVFSRGGLTPRILGSGAAYMVDPTMLITAPVATASVGSKGIAAVGRAMLRAGATEGLIELGIQGFVYTHKDEIDSPYGWKDALTNITMAASGAAVLTGAGKGVGDYIKSVREKTEELPEAPELEKEIKGMADYIESVREKAEELPETSDLELAKENLARLEDTIRANPNPFDEQAFVASIREELLSVAGNRLSRGDVKAITKERSDLAYALARIPDEPVGSDIDFFLKTEKGVPARAAKKAAVDSAKRELDLERATIQSRIEFIDDALRKNDEAQKAFADLSRIEQGIIPDEYKKQITDGHIQAEAKWLETLETKRAEINEVYRKKEDYELPEVKTQIRGSATARERSVLERQGLADDYDNAMAKLNEIGGPQPRKAFDIDQDFKGVKIKEKVRVKETGQVVEVDADADVLWRRASKRRKALTVLEDCLNA